ncbi:hypothetical protein MMC30_003441 [Trapelia coarctata]|nr:hypothetical protein [Trapelia coarctata]
MFSKTHHAKSPYRRLCKGSIYHVELNPHWSMGFRPMSNLITNLQPYNSFVMPSGPPARFFTSGLYALPGYSQDDSNVMRRHGQPFLVFNPEETSEFYPNRNFSLPAVAIAPLPGQPTYAFFPLVVSSAWLRKGDDSILLVSKWTFRKDIKMQEQWDKSAILAEVRQHSFNICPHVKLNDKRVVHAVSEHHAPIPRRITVDCSQCATAINVSSSKEAIPELPTHTSYKIVLIVERNLGKFKTPTDPEWLAQLALETMDGKQTSMPLCLQACCRWTP